MEKFSTTVDPLTAKKYDLVTELANEHGSTRAMVVLRELLDVLTVETRMHNDYVQPEDLKLNQGRISAYTQLRDYIVKGVPVAKQKQ